MQKRMDDVMKTIAIKLMLVLGTTVLACSACGSAPSKTPGKNMNVVPTKWEKPINQSVAHKAESILKKQKGVTEVRAVNTKKELMVAMKLKTFYRLSTQQMGKKFEKMLKKRFPGMQVQVSSDSKIFSEITDLEKQLKKGNVNEKRLAAHMKRIDKFMKDQDPSKQ